MAKPIVLDMRNEKLEDISRAINTITSKVEDARNNSLAKSAVIEFVYVHFEEMINYKETNRNKRVLSIKVEPGLLGEHDGKPVFAYVEFEDSRFMNQDHSEYRRTRKVIVRVQAHEYMKREDIADSVYDIIQVITHWWNDAIDTAYKLVDIFNTYVKRGVPVKGVDLNLVNTGGENWQSHFTMYYYG